MIGRRLEQERLLKALRSGESEFIAVYGRRRVGKTYLVRETFGDDFAFEHAGLANTPMRRQLQAFRSSLKSCGHVNCPALSDWIEAFDQLKELLERETGRKKVVFIDELPWMDTPRSGFVSALEHFWNGWAAWQKDIVFIICGSATSWIINNVLKARGGLHNRVTQEIALKPFTLSECEEFASSKGLAYTRQQIVECYMALGGVPFYWKFLERGLSPAQNIDLLFMRQDAYLSREFDTLYNSIFKNPQPYRVIIHALTKRKNGLSRRELSKDTGLPDNGKFGQFLEELEQCGFIRSYRMFGKTKNGMLYQLVDNYTRFYADIISDNREDNPQFWSSIQGTPKYNAWRGLAFEMVCLEHVDRLKQALGISGVVTNVCCWRSSKTLPGAQIDLLLDRKDGIINLCEMKFTSDEFVLNEAEISELCRKREVFRSETGTRKAIHITLVSANGSREAVTSSEVQSVITLDSLFE
ncbi:MAG: ATP-binding protein [Victivallales bacterium]|nr:ATP-binding protein [Victivallales bacterium]